MKKHPKKLELKFFDDKAKNLTFSIKKGKKAKRMLAEKKKKVKKNGKKK